MESQHFVGKIAQKALVVESGKVLAVLNVGDTKWNLPGGRLHRDETPQEGLAREIREELGIEVEIGEPIHVDTFISESIGPHFSVFYRATLAGKAAFTLQADEIAEVRWLSPDELDILWEDCQEAACRVLAV